MPVLFKHAGRVVDASFQGLGEFVNDDGSKIEGFWRENMLNGKITIKFADGSILKSVNYNDDKAMADHVFADWRQ